LKKLVSCGSGTSDGPKILIKLVQKEMYPPYVVWNWPLCNTALHPPFHLASAPNLERRRRRSYPKHLHLHYR